MIGPTASAPDASRFGYDNLTGTDRLLAEMAARPRWPIYAATAAMAALGWVWIAFMAQASSGALLEWFDAPVFAWVAPLCGPVLPDAADWQTVLMTFSMWAAMSLAMMLPSAAPLVRTYADIADTAAAKGQRTVSMSWLVAGYLLVWLAFAAIATAFQLGLIALGGARGLADPATGLVSGVVLLAAGAYQLSSLRQACLEKCRNPFTVLFARWSDRRSGVFRLGLEQGLLCLGCCWALMLVMLVVGTMNLAWMALLTVLAVLEKSGAGKVTSVASSVILLTWGSALLALQALSF